MVWKVGNDSVVFIMDDIGCADVCDAASCAWIRSKACDVLKEQGIEPHGSLEVRTFLHGQKHMVFATYIQERQCRELYRFSSVDALLDAYQSDACGDGELLYYDGGYYAALFDTHTAELCEYADTVPNAKNYYTFLCEHGKIISKAT